MEEKNIRKHIAKVEGKKWTEAIDKAIDNAIKKVKIDGFRPGHAPKEVFLKKYGKESVYMDAADLCLQEMYNEMLEANKDVELISQPEMAIKKVDDKGLEVEFTLTLRPEIKLGKYTGLNVKKESTKVTQKEIDDTITQMRSRYAENKVKDGSVEKGNVAVIDFEGFKDQVIGMKKGEVKEIEVTFPKDYQEESLKGAKATFKVTVKEIKEVVIPELNKDFFEDLGMEGIDSKEALEAQVKENLTTQKESDAENKYMDDLLEAAAKNVKVEIPDVMIKEEEHRMVHQYEENLKMQGLSLDQFYKFTHSNEEALMEQMKDEATKRVTYRLMLEEIAKVEKLAPTKEEMEKEAEDLAKKYQMEKNEFLTAFGGIEMVGYDMQMRKAM